MSWAFGSLSRLQALSMPHVCFSRHTLTLSKNYEVILLSNTLFPVLLTALKGKIQELI